MSSKTKTFFAIACVIALTIFLHTHGWLSPIERGISSTFRYGSRPFSAMYRFFQSHKNNDDRETMSSEINRLTNELQQKTIDSARLSILEEENKELREQLNFFDSGQYAHIGAEVVGRTVDPLGTTIILNKGKDDGVLLQSPVIVGNGILIGVVISDEPHSSVVRLINDSNSKIGAMVMNGERSIGLLEGGYGLGIHMNFIPQNEIISPGDTIVTSGLTENMPRGLIIGTVEVVEKQPHEPFQQAAIKPASDLSYLYIVSILTAIPS